MQRPIFRFSKNFLRRARQEPLIPVLLLILAGSFWAFVEIADEVSERDSRQFDERILLAMRTPDDLNDPVGPVWLEEAARDVTALGGYTLLTGLTLASIGIVLFLRRRHLAWLILAATAGGTLLSNLLKHNFSRPRPDLVPHHSAVMSASFPSGHSMMSAVVYLTLGVLLARALPGRGIKIYIVSLSVVIAVLVGVSRVYLGVHWPTDVAAGWAMGSAWALAFWLLALRLDPRNRTSGLRERLAERS